MSTVTERASLYKKTTLEKHILERADTYVGSKEPEKFILFVPELNEKENVVMKNKEVTYVPAFLKIFDEILVNAADNSVRESSTDTIKVTIDRENCEISIFNNGTGIPVSIHPEENIYVPELIFGHLLTSSNYDDDEKKVTGGRNGFGAKLTNLYSLEFTVETHDSMSGKTYKQSWSENMTKCKKPKITTSKKSDYTKITFKPHIEKIGMKCIDDDTFAVLTKRVYDLCGALRKVKIYLNGEKMKINSFKDYIAMYLQNDNDEKPKIVYDNPNERWEIAVALSDSGTFQQVSFVNSIATVRGGTHVNHVTNSIVSGLVEILKKKDKKITVKPAQVRNQLFVFINCLIENPSFDSQTKETLTRRVEHFGSVCNISEAFMKKVVKLGVLDTALALIREKEEGQLKKTDGQKRTRLGGITKLQDANNAGSKKSNNCTLFLTEGDSALGFAVTGIPELENGRDFNGAYPLKGKMLNVRGATVKQRLENKEICDLKQILGLKEGKEYVDTTELRYGRICILVDQDVDGKHIKGLILNWLEASYPSLLKVPGFVVDFCTPIVKCSKKNEEILHYSLRDYEEWKNENNGGKGWTFKYFKGLGTSKAIDVRKYFRNISSHLKRFRELNDEDSEKLDMAFNDKRTNDRKEWLKKYDPSDVLDDSVKVVSIKDFIEKDFIEFSYSNNIRAIPSVVDGLKPGQRKILYTALKAKITDIKVAQFSGKVSEMTEYRHGEQSLNMTITNMAQNFVGSNNIALLYPNGNFGTRLQGGNDAASPRYIYTYLKQTTRKIFHPDDDSFLDYIQEDGMSIEPKYYVPIIPMVLVNGANGIGTGYSTTVLSYNPHEIVALMKKRTFNVLANADVQLTPYYVGFKGKTKEISPGKWEFRGIVEEKDDGTLEITELPVKTWTQDYKEFLEKKLVSENIVKDYKEYHTGTSVHFILSLSSEGMKKLKSGHETTEHENLMKNLKLVSTDNTTNMMLFSSDGLLKKYETVGDIMEEFYKTRIEFYDTRKKCLKDILNDNLKWASNKVRFIKEISTGVIELRNKKRDETIAILTERKYDKLENTFAYLLNMPFWNLTAEKIASLENEKMEIEKKLAYLEKTSAEEMYRLELDDLEKALIADEKEEEVRRIAEENETKMMVKGKKTTNKAIKTSRKSVKK